MSPSCVWVALSVLAFGAWASVAESQEFRATLVGRVTDASGTPVAGARIVVTRHETNARFETVSGDRGHYLVPSLSPGAYRIEGSAAGFKTSIRDGLVLRTAERVEVDFTLDIGLKGETITVAAGVSDVDSNQSILAQTMENRWLTDLPLNGRQVYMLLQLTAGAFNHQTTFRDAGSAGTRAWDLNGNYSIHGGRPDNNEFLIDGSPHSATGGWQYAPVVDAIEELKVQAASVDASYGRTSGGVVNLTLKSGTNDLRGSAFLFHRSDALDANTTQNNRAGIPKSGHRFNDYGVVLSGPLRQERTFFMGYFDRFRDQVPQPRTVTVPTARQRLGDFSETFNSAGQLITIYDPLTTRPDPSRPGRFIRDPFPGNRIPPERLSAVARRLLAHIPHPNAAGEPLTQAGNLAASPNLARLRYDSYLLRLDHHFRPGHRLFLTSTANWGAEFRSENGFPVPALRGNWPRRRNHYLHTLDHVWAAGPRAVLNLRASFDRFSSVNTVDYAVLREDLGIGTPFQVVAQYPYLTIEGYEGFFPNPPRETVNHIYSGQASSVLGLGSHSLKVGGELRSYSIHRYNLGEGNGRFHFGRGFTQRDPQAPDATSGNAFASFLLGLPAEGRVEVTSPSDRRYLYGAAFLQDDWKVTPRLSLSLGLRWDYQHPVTDRLDRLTVGFDTRSPSPFQVAGLALQGGLLFAGPDRRSPYPPEYGAFQPRLSAGYKVSRSFVLRANYGRSYLPLTGSGQEGFQQTGFTRVTTLVSSMVTGIPFHTLDLPFPEGILQPLGPAGGLATGIGSGFTFTNPAFKVPYVDQWMAGFTLNLYGRGTLDVGYVGSRTARLSTGGRAINEVPLSERQKAIERLGGRRSYLSEPLPNPFAGQVPGTPLNGATVPRRQLLRPFPQFLDVFMEKDNAGSARYDALEVTARTRLPAGLSAVATYTWMKSREAVEYLNNGYDARPHWALAANDRAHRFTLTALWELPGGWQLNAIGEIQSGTPTGLPRNAVLLQPSARLPQGRQSLERWFDNSTRTNPRPDGGYAWDVLAPNELATAAFRMSDLRDPWEPQWAFSLLKSVRFGERGCLQLRLETFNAFNTPIYGGPDTGVTSSRFGRITPDQINFPRHVQLGLRLMF